MKRAFVTGAAGFIGSYLVRELVRIGVNVAVLRRPESDGTRLSDIEHYLHPVNCSEVTVAAFSDAFRRFAPDTVFHMGWAGVSNTHRNDVRLQLQNMEFSVDLASLSADAGVQCWIGAGSQAEYGPQPSQINELVRPVPTHLYGAAKLSAGILTERISSLRGMRHAWLRIFSTYGPMDNAGWMLPSLISQLLRGERPSLTAGEQLWDYLHVEDAAKAFVAVANSNAHGIFNLGSGEAHPLRAIIEIIRDEVNPDLPLGFGEVPYRTDQVMILHADVSSLSGATGWRAQIPLKVGLSNLIKWTRDQGHVLDSERLSSI